jgi:L,D-transpeptidase-like protein
LNRLSLLVLVAFVVVSSSASRADESLRDQLMKQASGLNPKVLDLALQATKKAWKKNLGHKKILTVIDYSLASSRKRLWVFDLEKKKVLFFELVAHGKGSGADYAKKFSNESGSLATSLGLFETSATYSGKHGYSLKLKGLEKGINDKALERAIVIHGAWYVTAEFAKQHGRLGRSWGCPALDKAVAKKVIDTIKDGSLVFAYYPDKKWLATSQFLD